jgi:hypothetical protein
VHGKAADAYPINRLRNLAIQQARPRRGRAGGGPCCGGAWPCGCSGGGGCPAPRPSSDPVLVPRFLLQVHTTHFLMTDIDLWPSSTAYKTILHSRLLKSARAAMVLPAFEFHNDRSKKITRDNRGNQEVHGRTTSRRDARPRKRAPPMH